MIRLRRESDPRVALFNDPDTPRFRVLGIHRAEGFPRVWQALHFRKRVEGATRGLRAVGWSVATRSSVTPPSVSGKVCRGRLLQPGAYEAADSVLRDRARRETL
jgi:hypothetical protein